MKIISFLFLMAFFVFNQSTGHPFGQFGGYVPYGYGAFGYRPNYGTLVQGIPGYPFGQYRGIGSYYGGYRRNYVYGDQVWDNSYGTSVQGIPVNGNWGAWTDTTSCSVTCGSGTKTQTRLCDNPEPGFGGSSCRGSSSQSVECSNNHCPDETINDPNEKAEYKADCCDNKKEDQPKRCEDLQKQVSRFVCMEYSAILYSIIENECRSGQVWSKYHKSCVEGLYSAETSD